MNRSGRAEGDSGDAEFIKSTIDDLRPDCFVCANDLTAGRLITALTVLGIEVPRQMRVVGMDDVKNAGLFSVPLTTQHQNCLDIGSTALGVMLQRIARPHLPTRDVLLQTYTVIRESCGARMQAVTSRGDRPGRSRVAARKSATHDRPRWPSHRLEQLRKSLTPPSGLARIEALLTNVPRGSGLLKQRVG